LMFFTIRCCHDESTRYFSSSPRFASFTMPLRRAHYMLTMPRCSPRARMSDASAALATRHARAFSAASAFLRLHAMPFDCQRAIRRARHRLLEPRRAC